MPGPLPDGSPCQRHHARSRGCIRAGAASDTEPLTPTGAQALQDESAAHGQWLMWVVTDADAEHPGKVVARAQRANHQGGTRLPSALVADTLDELRVMLPIDLTRRDRTSALPPDVLETWD